METDKQRLIIEYRNFGLTYREIGEKLGISRQRVYQLYKPEKKKQYDHWWGKSNYHDYINH